MIGAKVGLYRGRSNSKTKTELDIVNIQCTWSEFMNLFVLFISLYHMRILGKGVRNEKKSIYLNFQGRFLWGRTSLLFKVDVVEEGS